ncbi:MAG: TetR/AcrR family transcriptional regulator [Stackebrandtia sp.]
MSTDDRRAAIVEATLPLIVEHGMNVTTSQIAAAAGIAEGTVYRVFGDKTELIHACVTAVVNPEEGLRYITETPRDLDLEARLTHVAQETADRMRRIGAVMHTLMATGFKPERLGDKSPVDREKWVHESVAALVKVIGPDADGFRLPARRIAYMFFALIFSTQFAGRVHTTASEDDQIEVPELVHVFLHGVLTKDSDLGGKQ